MGHGERLLWAVLHPTGYTTKDTGALARMSLWWEATTEATCIRERQKGRLSPLSAPENPNRRKILAQSVSLQRGLNWEREPVRFLQACVGAGRTQGFRHTASTE